MCRIPLYPPNEEHGRFLVPGGWSHCLGPSSFVTLLQLKRVFFIYLYIRYCVEQGEHSCCFKLMSNCTLFIHQKLLNACHKWSKCCTMMITCHVNAFIIYSYYLPSAIGYNVTCQNWSAFDALLELLTWTQRSNVPGCLYVCPLAWVEAWSNKLCTSPNHFETDIAQVAKFGFTLKHDC